MARTWRICGLTAALALTVAAGRANAQGTLQLELLDRGKPVPNTPISTVDVGDLLSQGKPAGVTNADGLALLDLGKASFPIGSRVVPKLFEIIAASRRRELFTLGVVALSANQIAFTVQGIVFMIPLALSQAAAARAAENVHVLIPLPPAAA